MTTTLPSRTEERAQTPGQWAVRWHVLVFAAAITLWVPACHLLWHLVLGHGEPVFRTRSYVPAPAASIANVLDGTWMTAMERYLREASPVTYWLRGTWNEMLFRLGVPQSREVHFGRDGWLFSAANMRRDPAQLRARRAKRLSMLRAVAARVEGAGLRLFVMVVPDKERVYADLAFEGSEMPESMRPLYGELLADLGEVGIATVDLQSVLVQARAAQDAPVYKPRDSHWEPIGALAAAGAVAAAITAAGLDRTLAARQDVGLGAQHEVSVLGDLVGSAGFLAIDVPGPPPRCLPASALTFGLLEPYRSYQVLRNGPDGLRELPASDRDAEVVLAGTSFSKSSGGAALRLALRRSVHAIERDGATGLPSIAAALDELSSLPKAKLLVWEIVERGFFEPGWEDPRL